MKYQTPEPHEIPEPLSRFQAADQSCSDAPCLEDFSGLKGVTCHSTSEILVDSMKLRS